MYCALPMCSGSLGWAQHSLAARPGKQQVFLISLRSEKKAALISEVCHFPPFSQFVTPPPPPSHSCREQRIDSLFQPSVNFRVGTVKAHTSGSRALVLLTGLA